MLVSVNRAQMVKPDHDFYTLDSKPPSMKNKTKQASKSAKSAGKSTLYKENSPPPQEVNTLVALFSAGRYPEFLMLAQAMTVRFPAYGIGWKALGAAFMQVGRKADALLPMQKAAALLPNDAEAHFNLGNTFGGLGRPADAEASYRRALQIKPAYVEAYCNLGNVLGDLGRLTEALACYRQAVQIRPDYAEAHCNLGVTLKDLGRPAEAEASYRRALLIRPDYADAHNNLGNTLKDLGRPDAAEASYHSALQIRADYAEAHCNLGVTLKDLGRLDEAQASYHRALQIKPDFIEACSNVLFTHNFLADQPPATLLAEARRFGDMVARQATPNTVWQNVPDVDKCLRIGWVSGDLCNHPVGYFVESVMAALASGFSGRLELIVYASSFQADTLTERIRSCCLRWHSVAGLSDERLARKVREDGIDILIDLSGHTAHNRLSMFAWKPAPVQLSWLGYFATTGVAAIDYLIADPWALPSGEEANFTESIWRLPETRLCFTPPESALAVSSAPVLRNGYVTFGCFNHLTKINAAVIALWARVLQSVPDSRLFLKAKQLNEASLQVEIEKRFAVHGIVSDRLILEGPVARADYLSAYDRVDIALDPFPFPGGTTSAESLWMGVPVLTLAGQSFLSRQGVGILMSAGLPDWIAVDANDYVAKALAYASDAERLAELRTRLREQLMVSPLFDAARFAGHFDAAMRGMWARWCAQQGE